MPAILAFGELLWDVFPDGEFVGGAPFNVAAHAARCGLGAALYSRVGADARGARARAEAARLGVDAAWIGDDPALPTGWVDVTLRDGQPTYAIGAPAAWDAIAAPDAGTAEALRARKFSALVFGTLAQRSTASREALRALRRVLPAVPAVYDVNLRPPHTPPELVREALAGTALLKVNDEEAAALARAWWGAPVAPGEFFRRVRDEAGVRLVVLTRGAQGCLVLSGDGVAEVPAVPVRVASAVGAGDAFLAAFLAGWLRGVEPAEAARLGGWVASRPEAIPDYPADLAALLAG